MTSQQQNRRGSKMEQQLAIRVLEVSKGRVKTHNVLPVQGRIEARIYVRRLQAMLEAYGDDVVCFIDSWVEERDVPPYIAILKD